jgi:hypothetical protein
VEGNGVRFDPRRLETIKTILTPETGADLLQFLCAGNWMRTSLPEYSALVAPLHEVMNAVYEKAGNRTTRAVKRIDLAQLWTKKADKAFALVKERLAAALALAHPKEGYSLHLFTDDSDTHWSSVLTQAHTDQVRRSPTEQDHEPLSFLSGSFTGSAAGWSTIEKEGFPIVESFERLNYLVVRREVSLWTDHRNLTYIFDPAESNPGVSKNVESKLLRWALRLSGFSYVTEHLSGKDNVWADLLTRWAVQYRKEVPLVRLRQLRLIAPITPGTDEKYDRPSTAALSVTQERLSGERPSQAVKRKRQPIQTRRAYGYQRRTWRCRCD